MGLTCNSRGRKYEKSNDKVQSFDKFKRRDDAITYYTKITPLHYSVDPDKPKIEAIASKYLNNSLKRKNLVKYKTISLKAQTVLFMKYSMYLFKSHNTHYNGLNLK